MRRLSGETLSRLLHALQQCNESERSRDDMLAMLTATTTQAKDMYVEVPDAAAIAQTAQQPAPRYATFDAGHLARLNALLPWSSFAKVADDAVLGTAWSSHKRSLVTPYPDPAIEALNRRIPMAGMSALELGCFEGHHSISLGAYCGEVWGIDGRIENVIKTLVRVWLAGLESRITVNLLDLERGRMKEQLATLGRTEAFDLTHHRGVLYHLSNPVENLVQCAEVTRRHLYLHTQIAHETQADTTLTHTAGKFAVFRFREPNVAFAPFSGITPYAYWMTKSSLEQLLRELGFAHIETLSLKEQRNGPRLELLASR